MTTPPTRVALRALLAAATPGPWTARRLGVYGRQDWREIAAANRSKYNDTVAKVYRDGATDGDQELLAGTSMTVGKYEREQDNAALIAAAVNALPGLLDALDAAEADAQTLREALEVAHGYCVPSYSEGHPDDVARDQKVLDMVNAALRGPTGGGDGGGK
jgi:hypothetical protein